MSITSKSPMAVARSAYAAGRASLPRYSSKFSRHDFFCAQLLAMLALRQFFKTDYRGIILLLSESPELRDALLLGEKPPHFTTVQKAGKRLLAWFGRRIVRTHRAEMERIEKKRSERDDVLAASIEATQRRTGATAGSELATSE